jgi:hypothetical protein
VSTPTKVVGSRKQLQARADSLLVESKWISQRIRQHRRKMEHVHTIMNATPQTQTQAAELAIPPRSSRQLPPTTPTKRLQERNTKEDSSPLLFRTRPRPRTTNQIPTTPTRKGVIVPPSTPETISDPFYSYPSYSSLLFQEQEQLKDSGYHVRPTGGGRVKRQQVPATRKVLVQPKPSTLKHPHVRRPPPPKTFVREEREDPHLAGCVFALVFDMFHCLGLET